MYQVIARKYRPQSFSELIGQEHVRTTLENAISQHRIAHGYIFSGQRGTGKTTVARIMSRCLNCAEGPTMTPCGVCSSCREISGGNAVDVIEIDAASNRGINEMRELRESVRYRPARDRYKVFIVDEAHQITNEAFNALLKTLEEPPEWVVFILCTTESHKIPTTIASRCQQFSFRSVPFPVLIERMEEICQKEGISADPAALAVLAQAGEGSVRDSLSALDQAIACCGNTLQEAEVRALLGLFSLESLGQVTNALITADSKRMLEIVQELESNGRSLQHFCRELARYFRNLLVVKVAGSDTPLVPAIASEREQLHMLSAQFSEEDLTRYLQLTLDLFRDLQYSLQPRLHLEIGLLRLVHAGRLITIEQAIADLGSGGQAAASPQMANRAVAPAPVKQLAPTPTPVAQTAPAPAPVKAPPPPAPPKAAAPEPPPPPAPPVDASGLAARLHAALMEAGKTFTADAVLETEVSEQKGEVTVLTTKGQLPFLDENDIKAALQTIYGRPIRLKLALGSPVKTAPAPAAAAKPDSDETMERALSHPEIQRFQELFPDGQVRGVRNLKE